MDRTEPIRRELVDKINSQVESMTPESERERLEAIHGKVWDTEEATKEFEFKGFMAPFAVVSRREDSKEGVLAFQHMPRFYFDFQES